MLASVPAAVAAEVLQAAGVPGAEQAGAAGGGPGGGVARLRQSGGAVVLQPQQQPGRRMVQVRGGHVGGAVCLHLLVLGCFEAAGCVYVCACAYA
jgi:hypothetical protein